MKSSTLFLSRINNNTLFWITTLYRQSESKPLICILHCATNTLNINKNNVSIQQILLLKRGNIRDKFRMLPTHFFQNLDDFETTVVVDKQDVRGALNISGTGQPIGRAFQRLTSSIRRLRCSHVNCDRLGPDRRVDARH